MLDLAPPQNLEMEQAALGSMLIQPDAIDAVAVEVKAEDFYRESHQHIFRAVLSLTERHEPVDVLTVQTELTNQALFEQCGGLPYLLQIVNSVVTPSNAGHYATEVRKKAIRRRLLEAAGQITAAAYSDNEDIDAVASVCERALTEATNSALSKEPRGMRPLVSEAFEELEAWAEQKRHVTGLTTGIDDLDYLTRGLQPQSLYVVAARPGMGKSALAGMWAALAAKQGKTAFIASLEMSDRQLVHRMIATWAKVDGHGLRTGFITTDEWRRIGEASARLSELPIYIMDNADMTLTQLRLHCRRMARKGLGLVVVDYMQLLDGEVRRESRSQEIDIIAKTLKGIAKEHNCPVVALSQLSREVEKRPGKRPQQSDIRESGGIEAAADCVIFPFNPAFYKPNEREDQEPVEIIVAKQRDGITGVAHALWFRRWTMFGNLAKEYDTPPQPHIVMVTTARRVDLDGPADATAQVFEEVNR